MSSLDDVITVRGWSAEQALNIVAILEEFIDAIWKVHGHDMAYQLQLHFDESEHQPDH